jgi:hypothetical protein
MMADYVMRQGRRIAVKTLHVEVPKKAHSSRKKFTARWVKLPIPWIVALRRAKRASTYQLAFMLLLEAYERLVMGNISDIVVSSTFAKGIPRSTKRRAVDELEALGLIKVKRTGKQAPRVPISVFRFLLRE